MQIDLRHLVAIGALGIDAKQQLDAGEQAGRVFPDLGVLGVEAEQRELWIILAPSYQAAMKGVHRRSITSRSLSTLMLPCRLAKSSWSFELKLALAR